MQTILEEVGRGKTYQAISLSHITNAPIVCFDRREAERVAGLAVMLRIGIPFPLSLEEALPPRMNGSHYRQLIIDNADIIIQRLFAREVIAITICKERAKAVANTAPNKRLPGSQPKHKNKNGIVSAVRPKSAKRGLRVA